MTLLSFCLRKLMFPTIIALTTYFMDNSFNELEDLALIFVIAFAIVWPIDWIMEKYNFWGNRSD